MATKNIYVSEDDLVLFDRAAELAGGMSAAVALGLRLYVTQRELEHKEDEMHTIEVEVQDGAVVSTKRFTGRALLRYEIKEGLRAQKYRVYATERGQLAVHVRSDANWGALASPDEHDPVWDDPQTWQGDWWKTADRSFSVYPNVDSMIGAVPDDLIEAVRRALSEPAVHELDI